MPSSSSADSPIQFSVCPICCDALHKNVSELGALTYQGSRIEQSLYHSGCVALMLCHNGGAQKLSGSHSSTMSEIEWGRSPVSRKPVNGFVRLPPLDDPVTFGKFVDWKCDGKIDVEELSPIFAAMLPIEEDSAEDLVRQICRIDHQHGISQADLDTIVLPYLDLKTRRFPISQYQEAVAHVRNNCGSCACHDAAQLAGLRVCSRTCREVVRVQLCLQLRFFISKRYSRKPAEVTGLLGAAKALELLWQQGDPHAFEVVAMLLECCDRNVRGMGVKLAPVALSMCVEGAYRSRAPRALLDAARHKSHYVRQAAISCLVQLSEEGACRWVTDEIVRALRDSESDVRCEAVQCLAQVKEDWAIQKAMSCLSDCDHTVRHSAGRVLAQLAHGNNNIIELMCGSLNKSDVNILDADIRVTTVGTLAKIARKGDERVVRVLVDHIKDINGSNGSVRAAAASALGSVALVGDSLAVPALTAVVAEETDKIVVHCASQALAGLAMKRDKRVMNVFHSRCRPAEPHRFDRVGSFGNSVKTAAESRCQALSYFVQVAQPGDGWAFNVVLACLGEEEKIVKVGALEVLPNIVFGRSQQKRAVDVATSMQSDNYVEVQRAASKALNKLMQLDRNEQDLDQLSMFSRVRCCQRRLRVATELQNLV